MAYLRMPSFTSFTRKADWPLQISIIGGISVSLQENLIPNWGNDDKWRVFL